MEKKTVFRRKYLEWLDDHRDDTEVIKVIYGVRRCGKTTLMKQFVDMLMESGVPEDRIIRMNMESAEFAKIEGYEELNSAIYARMLDDGRYYIILDEVHRVSNWIKAVIDLATDTDADIYITKSGAIPSPEQMRSLVGPHVSLMMLPLSFSEYSEFRGNGRSSADILAEYMEYGGFPAVDPSGGPDPAVSRLQDIYASVVHMDLSYSYEISKIGELIRILRYLIENLGGPVTLSSIVRNLNGSSRDVVERYLWYMADVLLLYRVERCDTCSNKLSPTPKYYILDPGLS